MQSIENGHTNNNNNNMKAKEHDFDWKGEVMTCISGSVLILSVILCAQLSCWLENRRDRTRAARQTADIKKT